MNQIDELKAKHPVLAKELADSIDAWRDGKESTDLLVRRIELLAECIAGRIVLQALDGMRARIEGKLAEGG